MLDILVRELLAARTLCQADALAQSTVVGLGVLSVQCFDGVSTFYADGHSSAAIGGEFAGVQVGLWSFEVRDAGVVFGAGSGG